MGALAVGKIVVGRIFDKLGVKLGTLISMAAATLGVIGMCLSENLWMFSIVFIGIFMGGPFGTISPGVIAGDVFGSRDYSTKVGFITAAANGGCALCPYITGSVYDATGSYLGAMYIMLAMCVFITVGYMIFLPTKTKSYTS